MEDKKAETEGSPPVLENQEAEQATNPFTLQPFSQPFPPEIINTIIEILLNDEPPSPWTSEDDFPALHITPIRLVCRAWNQWTVSNPALWTRFFFKLEAGKLEWVQAQTKIGEIQMSRSGNHGLHLYISGWGSASEDSAASVEPFISFILQSSDRWASINIFGIAFEWLFASLVGPDGTRTRWSTLHTLNVSYCSLVSDGELSLPTSHFPFLRAIHIHKTYDRVLSWKLPWTQLTHLTISEDTRSLNENLQVLSQCTNLESLALIAKPYDDETSPLWTRVVVPNLSNFKLAITFADQRSLLEDVLPRLVFPRLRSLELHESCVDLEAPTDSSPPIQLLCKIVENSECELQLLHLHLLDESRRPPQHESALSALLQRTQRTLRTVVLDGIGFTGSCLRGFQPECLEDFVVQDLFPEIEDKMHLNLARWLRSQIRREGGRERCQKMKTTFHSQDEDFAVCQEWKRLEEEGYPLSIVPVTPLDA